MKIKYVIVLVVLFILSFFLRLYAIEHRTTFFLDDVFTFTSSSQSNLTPEGEFAKKTLSEPGFYKNKFYKAEVVKKLMFSQNRSVDSIMDDLQILRYDSIDRSHTNLYYSIFRIWGAVFNIDGTDRNKMIKQGCYLNLIFFTLSFFFMYKLLSLIKNDKYFVALGLFFAFISTAGVSVDLMIREYSLQLLLFIVANYIFLLFYKKVSQHDKIRFIDIFLYSLGFALFLLSNYFSVIYTLFLYFAMLATCIYYKNWKSIISYLCILVLTTYFLLTIYPVYFFFHFGNSICGYMHNEAIKLNLYEFKQTFVILIQFIKRCLFYPIILYLIIVILAINMFFVKLFNSLKDKFGKQNIIYLSVIIILSFIFAYVSMKIAPFKEFRYMAVTNITFSLVLTIFTYLLNRKFLQYIIVFSYLVLSVIAVVKPVNNEKFARLYNGTDLHMQNVELAFDNNYPVIFTGYNWFHNNYILYLKDSQYVMFVYNLNDVDLPREYILITDKQLPDYKPFDANNYDSGLYAYIIKQD